VRRGSGKCRVNFGGNMIKKNDDDKRGDGKPVSKEDLKKSEEMCPICGKSVHDCPGHKGK